MSEQSVKPVVVIAVGVIASMSFNTGYDIGIMSSAKRLMALDLDLSPWQVSVLVGSLNIVTALASLLSGLAADTLGRKRLILLSSFICTVAVLLMGAASGPNAFAMVMLGRTFNGIGTGLALQVSQCFVAEIAPKHIRGLLGASFELFINIGILMGYIGGWALSGLPVGTAWRLMIGLGAVPPAVVLLVMPCMPESPRFLLGAGRADEAERVLYRIYAPAEAAAALQEMQEEAAKHAGAGSGAGLLTTARLVLCAPAPRTRQLAHAALMTAFLQQASGVEAATYYTPEVMEAAGVEDEASLQLATIAMGAVKVSVIGVAAAVVDRCGRKPLLVASNAGIAAAQLLLSASFASGGMLWAALAGQCLFMATFSAGVGPCTWLLIPESFPLAARGVGVGIATFINRMAAGGIALVFSSLIRTPAGTFLFFAMCAAGAAAYTSACVVETKGLSLEEIHSEQPRSNGAAARAPAAAADPARTVLVRSE